ncbi:aldehyde dehydrogenase family protein [Salibacterium salarium]|uniref:Aldehyde dehydrogenase family protein n=1 Tax=Salibacterium salarium TaxID=284579 RepID=A0A428MVD5_9BACI|nr:aldehyde dehydrogenase family protein [Salibacterium salarium]RSL30100.1 aldehyde dehydrogenase family protein [Salibacterium salarium]
MNSYTFNDLNKQAIAGSWRDGNGKNRMKNTNPYSLQALGDVQSASADDLDQAYESAHNAQKEWIHINPYQRRDMLLHTAQLLEKREEEITELIIDELGGTRLKAAFEIGLVKDMIKEAATYPLRMDGQILPSPVDGKENRVYRMPVGVVGVISPFNFPFYLSMKSVVTAIGAGNGVVIKPHEDTPVTGGTMIVNLFEESGLPLGLVNAVITEISEIGDRFVSHPLNKVVSFTGSTTVGRKIGELAGKYLKKASLELGGNSALIVLDDADIDYAVSAAVFSRFTHQGQICMSANRIIVHESIKDTFLTKYKEVVSSLTTGDPRDGNTIIGPLINKKQVDTLMEVVNKGIEEGATPYLKGDVDGNVVSPTILTDVKPEMTVANQELFGPVVSVLTFKTDEEAVEIANASDYGLSGAVHTADVERGAELAKRMETGMIHVNDGTINDEPLVAFGGEKMSGVGRLNGSNSLDAFTTQKWISVQHTKRTFPYS